MTWQVDENKPWFKELWPKNCPKNIEFKEISCGDFFESQRMKIPNKVFMAFYNTIMTYDEAGNYIDALATSFYTLGMRKGDILALIMPNCFQYILSFYACMKIGVIVVPIDPNLKKGQILKILKITRPVTIIIMNILWKSLMRPLISQIKIDFLIYTGLLDFVKNKKKIQREYGKVPLSLVDFPNAIRLLDLAKSLIQLPIIPISSRNDLALYISTAGSTDDPKICMLTHFNLVSNALQCGTWFGKANLGIGNLGIIPLYNPFGITCVMNATIALGGWVMLFPKQPSAEQLLVEIHYINEVKGLLLFGPDRIFRGIIENVGQIVDLNTNKKIKYGVVVGSPLYSDIKEVFQNVMGGKLLESYGLTEAGPVISIGNLEIDKPVINSGLPLPGTDVGIFDPLDFEGGPKDNLGKEHIGEICVRGPQIMDGYLGNIESTRSVLKKFNDGTWLCTGDLGYMNENGTITLTKRKQEGEIKLQIVPSYLVDVEMFLLKLEPVKDVAVLGLPPIANVPGTITKLWITLNSEYMGKVKPEEFGKWIEEKMPEYTLDADIEFIKAAPKHVLGKIQKQPINTGKLESAKRYL